MSSGILLHLIITVTCGLALVVTLREVSAEVMRIVSQRRMRSLDTAFAGAREKWMDSEPNRDFIVEDAAFTNAIERMLISRMDRCRDSGRAVTDSVTYLVSMCALGIVAAAGFIAGISHF